MTETLPDFKESRQVDYDGMTVELESLEDHFARPAFERPIARTAFEILAAESIENSRGVDGYTMLKSTPQDDGSVKMDEDDY